jgi:hypothetical protein
LSNVEDCFTALRHAPPDLAAAADAAFAALPRPDPAIRALGSGLAAAVGDESAHADELPYHNRYHVSEAVRSMGLLCGLAVESGLITDDLASLGVLAMIGHDWGHDGTPGGDGRLERLAADRVVAWAGSLDAPSRGVLEAVILATNPTLVDDNAARAAGDLPAGKLGPPVDALCHIANEADVFASLLPELGWLEAEALAEEWHATPRAREVMSFAGRLQLLRTYHRFSPPAVRIGLAGLCARQVGCFVPAAGMAAGAAPEEAAEKLDAMPRAQARAAYRAAFAALG